MRGKNRIILEQNIVQDWVLLECLWADHQIKNLNEQVQRLRDKENFWFETSEDYKRIIYEQFSRIRQYKKLLKLPNLPVML